VNEKLLIFDLDETLVLATAKRLAREPDFEVGPYGVYKRPYVDELIAFCAAHFKIAVWTSSTENYAAGVVRQLFAHDEKLELVYARKKCVQRFDPEVQDYFFIKDLRKVKPRGFALTDIIILDDTPQKLMRNYGNLVRVTEWTGDEADRELQHVQALLLDLKAEPNIRAIEKRGWLRKYAPAHFHPEPGSDHVSFKSEVNKR
jgi:TFIIF-interacting CTD phosphatase-like protein